jgi:beta-phosphoglucomutase-like phosphatase (HAD superfamily)
MVVTAPPRWSRGRSPQHASISRATQRAPTRYDNGSPRTRVLRRRSSASRRSERAVHRGAHEQAAEATRLVLHGLDLARYFDDQLVIGGDGPHARKPDPAGLLALTRLVGVEPRAAVLVGDSVIDWKTARAAGTQLCVARYGFGFDGFPLDELAPGDAVVDSPVELTTLL